MTIARTTGALIGTNETAGVTVSGGTTFNGPEVDLLGGTTTSGVLRLYVCFTQRTDALVGLRVTVNSRRVSGKNYKNLKAPSPIVGEPPHVFDILPFGTFAVQEIALPAMSIGRFVQVDVDVIGPGTSARSLGNVANVAVLYELEATS